MFRRLKRWRRWATRFCRGAKVFFSSIALSAMIIDRLRGPDPTRNIFSRVNTIVTIRRKRQDPMTFSICHFHDNFVTVAPKRQQAPRRNL